MHMPPLAEASLGSTEHWTRMAARACLNPNQASLRRRLRPRVCAARRLVGHDAARHRSNSAAQPAAAAADALLWRCCGAAVRAHVTRPGCRGGGATAWAMRKAGQRDMMATTTDASESANLRGADRVAAFGRQRRAAVAEWRRDMQLQLQSQAMPAPML